MPNETKTIRDFIYMDVDRLNSLYSQVFGGVVPQILKSRSHEGTSNEEGIREEGQESLQEVLTRRLVTEARHETKNVILYDYLYTQFEEGIANSILSPQGLTRDNFVSQLEGAFLVKVEGNAEIEDYQRLASSSEKFLEVASDIAWVSGSGAAKALVVLMESQVQELQEQAKNHTGGERSRLNSQVTDLQREIKECQTPEKLRQKLVAQMGLAIDPDFMGSIARLFRYFSPDNFEVTILPSYGSEGVVFRGVLDRRLLRIHPEYLRVLYEGSVNKKWTMVREITRFPAMNQLDGDAVATLPSEEPATNDTAIKDVMRQVFNGLAELEGKFFESKARAEIRLRPLAIYQESEIQVMT